MRLSEAVEENGLEIEADIFNTRENSSGNLCLGIKKYVPKPNSSYLRISMLLYQNH